LEAGVRACFGREDEGDRARERERLQRGRGAFAGVTSPEERGHDPGADRGRRRAGHLHVEPEQREDGDPGRNFRQARAFRQPEQGRGHPGDVQSADREEMQRARRRERFLGVRGQQRRPSQHRGGEQRAAVRIIPRHYAQPRI